MSRFDGKVAIVTGAASGIGRATAARLGAEGARVACLDVQIGAGEETALAIPGARAWACDVGDPDGVEATVAEVVDAFGGVHVLANIAGIGRFAHTDQLSLEEWDRILRVNLTGTFLMCRAALPHLLSAGGAVVNTSSTAGIKGQPYSAAYSASKGGVALLTRSLAVEYSERGVRFNAVAPGGIDTPITLDFSFPEGASKRLLARMLSPMGMGRPEDVAGVIAFLASDDARHMSGSIVTIDGGMVA